jgi:hypothetical protein
VSGAGPTGSPGHWRQRATFPVRQTVPRLEASSHRLNLTPNYESCPVGRERSPVHGQLRDGSDGLPSVDQSRYLSPRDTVCALLARHLSDRSVPRRAGLQPTQNSRIRAANRVPYGCSEVQRNANTRIAREPLCGSSVRPAGRPQTPSLGERRLQKPKVAAMRRPSVLNFKYKHHDPHERARHRFTSASLPERCRYWPT